MPSNKQDNIYWASVPTKEIADNILEKVDKYYEFLQLSGRLNLYLRSYTYYYRSVVTGARLNPVGEQGELTALNVNNYRNLLVHLETMTLQQRPFFEPRATNSDAKSQAQVILAAGLLDYYSNEKKIERNIAQCVTEGLIYGEAFTMTEWDSEEGETYGYTNTGVPIQQGDVKQSNYSPLDMIRDYTKNSPNKDVYVIKRDFENKYDLAAQFPEISEEILDDRNDDDQIYNTTVLANALEDSDNIAVFTLIHKPTKSMPKGRYTRVLNNGTVLMDGPIPYKKIHLQRFAPAETSGTIFGYTVGFDLLPIQEAFDMLVSTVITNQAAHGVQNVAIPKGADISTSQLAGGLNVVEYDPKYGKPEPLQLTSTPKEIFEFINMLGSWQETISGINSAIRGNPEASLKSAQAIALVQAQAINFAQGQQKSYVSLVEDVGTSIIEILQQFAATPRVAAIAGKSNKPLMKEFVGQDLDMIQRVTVDIGNPLTNTTAGKTNLAESLADRGYVENGDQYIQVITTGRLEPVVEGKQAELLLIKGENEQLAEGQMVVALITDRHAQHIWEHKTVLANPDIRKNPNDPIVIQTLQHIQAHIDFLKTADPALLALIHEQSMMPPPMPMQNDGGTGEMLDPTLPVQKEANEVDPGAVKPPKNILTGEQAPGAVAVA